MNRRLSVFQVGTGLSPKAILRELGELFPLDIARPATETVVYRDTFDWGLMRAGLTFTTEAAGRTVRVRIRRNDGEQEEALLPRVPQFARDLPGGGVLDRARSAMGPRRLLPIADARWTEIRVAVLDENQKTVTRLKLRMGTVLHPRTAEEAPLAPRLECLGLKGYGREAKKVRSVLRRRFGFERARGTEESEVFRAAGVTPLDYSSSFELEMDPDTPASHAAGSIHRTLLKVIRANEEGVLKDWDPEFLHDFRVAVRRTRSALTQLKGVFPEARVLHFSREFRWLAARTGPARDLDVYLQRIPSYLETLGIQPGEELEPLVALLKKKKKAELSRLRATLRSRRYSRLMEDWNAFLDASFAAGSGPPRPAPGGEQPPDGAQTLQHDEPGAPAASQPIGKLAGERIWRAFLKVLERGESVHGSTSAKRLHRLRIQCKKLRYLITFFRNIYPRTPMERIIRELKRLQDHLGDFNDLQVQREALGRFAEELMNQEERLPSTLLAMGQLLGKIEWEQVQERNAFHRHFQEFSRPRNRERFRKLFGPRVAADQDSSHDGERVP